MDLHQQLQQHSFGSVSASPDQNSSNLNFFSSDPLEGLNSSSQQSHFSTGQPQPQTMPLTVNTNPAQMFNTADLVSSPAVVTPQHHTDMASSTLSILNSPAATMAHNNLDNHAMHVASSNNQLSDPITAITTESAASASTVPATISDHANGANTLDQQLTLGYTGNNHDNAQMHQLQQQQQQQQQQLQSPQEVQARIQAQHQQQVQAHMEAQAQAQMQAFAEAHHAQSQAQAQAQAHAQVQAQAQAHAQMIAQHQQQQQQMQDDAQQQQFLNEMLISQQQQQQQQQQPQHPVVPSQNTTAEQQQQQHAHASPQQQQQQQHQLLQQSIDEENERVAAAAQQVMAQQMAQQYALLQKQQHQQQLQQQMLSSHSADAVSQQAIASMNTPTPNDPTEMMTQQQHTPVLTTPTNTTFNAQEAPHVVLSQINATSNSNSSSTATTPTAVMGTPSTPMQHQVVKSDNISLHNAIVQQQFHQQQKQLQQQQQQQQLQNPVYSMEESRGTKRNVSDAQGGTGATTLTRRKSRRHTVSSSHPPTLNIDTHNLINMNAPRSAAALSQQQFFQQQLQQQQQQQQQQLQLQQQQSLQHLQRQQHIISQPLQTTQSLPSQLSPLNPQNQQSIQFNMMNNDSSMLETDRNFQEALTTEASDEQKQQQKPVVGKIALPPRPTPQELGLQHSFNMVQSAPPVEAPQKSNEVVVEGNSKDTKATDATTTETSAKDYENMSREQLIARLIVLENEKKRNFDVTTANDKTDIKVQEENKAVEADVLTNTAEEEMNVADDDEDEEDDEDEDDDRSLSAADENSITTATTNTTTTPPVATDFANTNSSTAGNNSQQKSQSTADAAAAEDEANNGPKQCKWKDCNEIFDDLKGLINHLNDTHVGSGKPTYCCEWENCGRNQKPFVKRHKMYNHLRTHTGERPFVCDRPGCGKKFSRPDSLTTHIKTHSNVRPFICSSKGCTKAYYHARSLKKHEKTHELEEAAANSSTSANTDGNTAITTNPANSSSNKSNTDSTLTMTNTLMPAAENNALHQQFQANAAAQVRAQMQAQVQHAQAVAAAAAAAHAAMNSSAPFSTASAPATMTPALLPNTNVPVDYLNSQLNTSNSSNSNHAAHHSQLSAISSSHSLPNTPHPVNTPNSAVIQQQQQQTSFTAIQPQPALTGATNAPLPSTNYTQESSSNNINNTPTTASAATAQYHTSVLTFSPAGLVEQQSQEQSNIVSQQQP